VNDKKKKHEFLYHSYHYIIPIISPVARLRRLKLNFHPRCVYKEKGAFRVKAPYEGTED
jgi:hypothetical protein